MDIGGAIQFMKMGGMVQRQGWNGKGMFLYFVPKGSYPARTTVAKEMFGEFVEYLPYIAMRTVDGTVVPWLASQTDLLATDYVPVGK